MAAPRIDRALTAARARLDAEDWEGALLGLLPAWREHRHPRLADVVDRVSERIARPAIEASSVAARTEAWLALAKKADPLDVGRLLATPWPGTWTAAKPLLAALAGFDDPRVSAALCRLLEATPYDTYKSSGFYGPLLRQIVRIGDLRALPLLEADLERTRTSYWRETTRPLVMRARTELRKLSTPPLDEAAEAALALLEAFFAGAQTAARGVKKSEAELLAAIWAALDDDAPRAVYADFLMERGDPRGELVAISCGATRTTRRRSAPARSSPSTARSGSVPSRASSTSTGARCAVASSRAGPCGSRAATRGSARTSSTRAGTPSRISASAGGASKSGSRSSPRSRGSRTSARSAGWA